MKYLEATLLGLLAVFAPIQQVIVASLVLIICDLITGVLAAHKRGEAITSQKLKATVIKLFLYEAALLLAFITEKYMIGELIPATKMVSTIVGITELKSIMENIDSISGNKIFKDLIEKLVTKPPTKSE